MQWGRGRGNVRAKPRSEHAGDQLFTNMHISVIADGSSIHERRNAGRTSEWVTLAQHDSRVTTIMVRDHGIGIGAEQIPVFFTRFGR